MDLRAFLAFLRRRWPWFVLAILVAGGPLEWEAARAVAGGPAYLTREITYGDYEGADRRVRLYLWLHLPLNADEQRQPVHDTIRAPFGKWDPSGHSALETGVRQPLRVAIESHRPDLVVLLLRHGANPNLRSGGGLLPLQMAAAYGEERMVEALLKAGAKVNAVDGGGCTALDAARPSSGAIFSMLLDRGGRLNLNRLKQNTSQVKLSSQKQALDWCLLQATAMASPSAVEAVLERGADPNANGGGGATPLLCVAAPNHRYYWGSNEPEACARILIKWGARVNDAATGGVCEDTRRPGNFDFEVQEFGAGWTPLHYAAAGAEDELVEVLLHAGANPRAKTADGQTPLDCASAAREPSR